MSIDYVRHIRNLPPLTFAVDERYFYSTIERMEKAKLMQNIITSNQPLYIKHLLSIFEQMWKNAVDAKDRIKDIQDRVQEVESTTSYNEENIKLFGWSNEGDREDKRITQSFP